MYTITSKKTFVICMWLPPDFWVKSSALQSTCQHFISRIIPYHSSVQCTESTLQRGMPTQNLTVTSLEIELLQIR